MLKFLGVGSAFNTQLGNTCAYVKEGNSLLLLDCGNLVFHRLMELRLLDEIEHIHVAVTHTHPDHVGSLGDLIFYTHYILQRKLTVYFPDRELLHTLLTCTGVDNHLYTINSDTSITINDGSFHNLMLTFTRSYHVETIPSYGITLQHHNTSLYYSGDSCHLEPDILDQLRTGKIKRIYHDTCGLHYDGNKHMSLQKLTETVEPALRDKIWCMHYDGHVTLEEIREQGFNTLEVVEETTK